MGKIEYHIKYILYDILNNKKNLLLSRIYSLSPEYPEATRIELADKSTCRDDRFSPMMTTASGFSPTWRVIALKREGMGSALNGLLPEASFRPLFLCR